MNHANILLELVINSSYPSILQYAQSVKNIGAAIAINCFICIKFLFI